MLLLTLRSGRLLLFIGEICTVLKQIFNTCQERCNQTEPLKGVLNLLLAYTAARVQCRGTDTLPCRNIQLAGRIGQCLSRTHVQVSQTRAYQVLLGPFELSEIS